MFNAIQLREKKIFLKETIDACWNAWNLGLTEHDDIVMVWNIIFDSKNIDRTHLVGWEQEYMMPVFSSETEQDFQYENEVDYDDECIESVMVELLNSQESESRWKMKFRNYLTWVGYVEI
jgi:hypothetical protein